MKIFNIVIIILSLLFFLMNCSEDNKSITETDITNNDEYSIDRTLEDGCQEKTIAFDGLASSPIRFNISIIRSRRLW